MLKTQLPLEENVPDSFNQVRKKEGEYIECDHKFLENNAINEFYKDTFEKIKKIINNGKENDKEQKYMVMFDAINDESLNALDDFLKFCFTKEINLLFIINKELNSQKVVNYIEYLSDILIGLKSNESGFSKDLNGILDITIKKELNEENKSFRYFLRNNRIEIFNHIDI